MNDEQQAALKNLRLRLSEWDMCGEGRYSATDFAAASRMVLRAFGLECEKPLPVEAELPTAQVVDLMEALKASLAASSPQRQR